MSDYNHRLLIVLLTIALITALFGAPGLYLWDRLQREPLASYWTFKTPPAPGSINHANGWECLYGSEPLGYMKGVPVAPVVCRKGIRIVMGVGINGGDLP